VYYKLELLDAWILTGSLGEALIHFTCSLRTSYRELVNIGRSELGNSSPIRLTGIDHLFVLLVWRITSVASFCLVSLEVFREVSRREDRSDICRLVWFTAQSCILVAGDMSLIPRCPTKLPSIGDHHRHSGSQKSRSSRFSGRLYW
jgi:hypothetical protein